MEKVQNIEQFKEVYKTLVPKLVQIRKQSGTNIDQMAEWLKVDRRKIMQFENLKKINLELLLLYGHKLSVDIDFKYTIE
jgi:DNA-binding XRE family transcriptional regulator